MSSEAFDGETALFSVAKESLQKSMNRKVPSLHVSRIPLTSVDLRCKVVVTKRSEQKGLKPIVTVT